MKKPSILFHRSSLYVLAFILQFAVMVGAIIQFQNRFYIFYGLSVLTSIVIIVFILNGTRNPAFKIAWVTIILIVPFFGGLIYFFLGRYKKHSRLSRGLSKSAEKKRANSAENLEEMGQLEARNSKAARQAHYLTNYAGATLHRGTRTTYLPTGEAKFTRLLKRLEEARQYIFLEYFIIEEGLMWNSILEILTRKVTAGVDVRVMYDHAGCIAKLPQDFDAKLETLGIRVGVFNPLGVFFRSTMQHRDHRKIAVIDGLVGFTGGINLADEYINNIELHGHWKDTAIELEGPGVWNLALMFLQHWDFLRTEERPYLAYRPAYPETSTEDVGWVIPYDDSPLDEERVGENVYLNLISRARNYVSITTPYLIVDNEMITALSLAAKSGVQVSIITPRIGDRRFVHEVTRTYYPSLIQSGVRIYEYLPGFIHSKNFVVDDQYGVVGTINMDYRSLFFHFECGVWMFDTPAVVQMKADFDAVLGKCQEITLEDLDRFGIIRKIAANLLRLFSPLL